MSLKIRLFCSILGALLAFPACSAWADENNPIAEPPPPPPATQGPLASFESFLNEHSNIEARLRESPSLLNNDAFLKNHPQLAEFLAQQPALNTELASHPRWFIRRELTRQTVAPVTSEQLTEFDHFLDNHPETAKQLAERPQLLRQPDFLKNHPELRDFIKQHPDLKRLVKPRATNPVKQIEKPQPRLRTKI